MKLLLIEDDPNKAKHLMELLSEKNHSVEVRKSYQSGLKAILSEAYDLIFLDMQLPTFDIKSGEDGYKFRKLAGIDILNELKRKKNTSKIIIVTQFETFGEGEYYMELGGLKKQLKESYSENYIETVYYNPSQTKWKNELQVLIEKNMNND